MSPFFTLAAISPARQYSLRMLVGAHLAILGCAVGATCLAGSWKQPQLLGNLLLVAGIVEGALLIGWRLTQLPKSQALEFLLVSHLRPGQVFLGEAAVGMVRLALVTLSGLPLLALYVGHGWLHPFDLVTLLALPLGWGLVTGILLTAWAYEARTVRRWGERIIVALLVLYLLVGVLAAEHLPVWLGILPPWLSAWFLSAFKSFHEDNPFGVVRAAMDQEPARTWARVLWNGGIALALAALLLARASRRLLGHFQDEHYRPATLICGKGRPVLGDEPLSWWAVQRVTRFSGRINIWLAWGFALLYGVYTVAEPYWPPWLGREVFLVFERMGGIPTLTTALVLLAAVPAAFQYGVWDSSPQDRARRLELLLLTDLDGPAYWKAAAAAAWRRGRGYLGAALFLWTAALLADQGHSWRPMLASLCAGVVLWGLYFSLGFWAFARGKQAGALGLALTLGVPLATYMTYAKGWNFLAILFPPAGIYEPWKGGLGLGWLTGLLVSGCAALLLARQAQAHCVEQLRGWYQSNHGLKAAE